MSCINCRKNLVHCLRQTCTVLQPEESCAPISNMPDWNLVKFQKTPIMSTYLLAIVVGEYDFLEKDLPSGVKIRVFTPKGKKDQGEFALDVACKALPYYSDYFQIPYPLPKLDLITIPDFSAGAMENWGLITYRECLLLCHPVNSSAQNKQRIAMVIAHELAHQWFGNLVTMQWWTHLWLNEGYANFSEYLCCDELFPEYQIWTQFLSDCFIPALQLDSLDSTHPVEVEVKLASDVDEIFDEISYDKGASVIRMLYRYLGEENFKKGMNLYLTRHQYNNTRTEDLWQALGEISGKPVEKVMSAWTQQPGFPMITVEARDDEENTVLHLKQSRFFQNGSKDTSNSLWSVPIDVVCSMDEKPRSILLEGEATTVILPKMPSNGWVKLNSGAWSFYRTKYSPDLLNRLIPVVKDQTLSPLDRVNILNDLYAMVKAGHSTTVELLNFLLAYKEECNYSVFMSMRTCILGISGVLSHSPDLKGLMAPFIRQLLSNIYLKLGWECNVDESYLDKLLRPLVLGILGENDEKSVVDKSRQMFADHLSETKIIPADLRNSVYRVCMSHDGASALDSFIKLFKTADTQEEKDRILRCMGATDKLDVLTSVLEFVFENARKQDIPFALYAASSFSAVGSGFIWDYFKKNYHKTFVPMYGDSCLMIRLVKFVSLNFASDQKATDVDSFFTALPSAPGLRGIQQNIESIRLNASWLKRDSDAIVDFFKQWQ